MRGLRRVLRRVQGPAIIGQPDRRAEGGPRLPIGVPRNRGAADPTELTERGGFARVLLAGGRGRRAGAGVSEDRFGDGDCGVQEEERGPGRSWNQRR